MEEEVGVAEAVESNPGELKKVLSFPLILLISINSIMGTGIFFLPALGATKAGPASLISWVILSIVSIYISMCFAELVSMFPTAGGVYEFCKQAYGKFPSFIIGWATVLAGNITIAMLVVGAIVYLIPGGATTFQTKAVVLGVSIFFIVAFNYIAYRGMQTSAVMLTTFAVITLGTLSLLIIPGLGKMAITGNINNFSPFFVFPVSTIFVTIFFVAETFFGWETATFLAEETKDAETVMPKALILSTVIIAVICILFVITTLGVIPLNGWENFPTARPLADMAKGIGYPGFGQDVITILVYLSIIGSVAGWIVSAPRLILALCRDKLFPGHLGVIHPKHGTPYKAIIFQTILTSLLIFIGIGSYESLLKLLLPIALILYALVIGSLIVLRIKKPELDRPYRQPFGIIGPALLIIGLIGLIVLWAVYEHGALNTLMLGVSLILIGIPLYFMIQMYYDSKTISKVTDYFAYLTLMTEFLFIPNKVVRHALILLGDLRGKIVLEFGCGVGTITKDLAQEIGSSGKLYATDVSMRQLKLTQMRLKNRKLENVRLIHDKLHDTRVNSLIPNVDAVISMGMLSYVQEHNVDKVLTDLYHRLDNEGKFCFVEYSRFFHIIPNVEWITSDEKVINFFKDIGFIVRIERKSSILFDYIFIYGIKYGKGIVYI